MDSHPIHHRGDDNSCETKLCMERIVCNVLVIIRIKFSDTAVSLKKHYHFHVKKKFSWPLSQPPPPPFFFTSVSILSFFIFLKQSANVNLVTARYLRIYSTSVRSLLASDNSCNIQLCAVSWHFRLYSVFQFHLRSLMRAPTIAWYKNINVSGPFSEYHIIQNCRQNKFHEMNNLRYKMYKMYKMRFKPINSLHFCYSQKNLLNDCKWQ